MSWRPVLEGDDAARAREMIARVAGELTTNEIADPSLVHGAAGAALLFGELARVGDERAAERAGDLLAHAIERLTEDVQPRPWLGTGIAGVAWVLHQLRDVVDVDPDTLADVDGGLLEFLAVPQWTHPYWLWSGATGLGLYGLERGTHELARRAVQQLDQLAERDSAGVTWWNDEATDRELDPEASPRGWHNLGMALGVSGAIAFLAETTAAGVAVPPGLLRDAVTRLLACERPDTRPRFPMCDGLRVPADKVRNSWCYGDATVAVALARAGQVCGESAWLDRARELALAMARGPIADVAVLDDTLCCGTAGRAHLLNRLAHALGDEELRAAARRYHVETLDRFAKRTAVWPHLTVGATGTALALHAAISEREPIWDRVFLAALPPR